MKIDHGIDYIHPGIIPEPDVIPCSDFAVAVIYLSNNKSDRLCVCQKHFDEISKELVLEEIT